MAWLLSNGQVLASLEVARSPLQRAKGMLGRKPGEGALLLPRARAVHSAGMGRPIDVAFLDRELKVLEALTLRPFRVTVPRPRARYVLEAEAGAFERWGLSVGDQVEIKE